MTRVLGRSGAPILIIGGLDPLGASGVLADLRALDRLPLWPLVVVSALTEQPHRVVAAPLFEQSLRQALAAKPKAIKVGMLANAAQARLVATLTGKIPLVLDPVLSASSGLPLYRSPPRTLQPLITRATVVTPNSDEALILERALTHARAILRKGGHAAGRDVIDTLHIGGILTRFTAKRRPHSVRGTGCALASRIAAELALGRSLTEAVARAERWLHRQYAAASVFLSPTLRRG